ncbi:hypothetical protein FHL15_004900 [Xylaria flabelliformis]|uniref:Uncharacterized protein n=1 Tax=Xylaria flabelliformis TaxID=2512241 RepID=A0A553I1R3_9PEZI|nr:hypothetical protein FHL15_004900 [Xylaria flabelliformis]
MEAGTTLDLSFFKSTRPERDGDTESAWRNTRREAGRFKFQFEAQVVVGTVDATKQERRNDDRNPGLLFRRAETMSIRGATLKRPSKLPNLGIPGSVCKWYIVLLYVGVKALEVIAAVNRYAVARTAEVDAKILFIQSLSSSFGSAAAQSHLTYANGSSYIGARLSTSISSTNSSPSIRDLPSQSTIATDFRKRITALGSRCFVAIYFYCPDLKSKLSGVQSVRANLD